MACECGCGTCQDSPDQKVVDAMAAAAGALQPNLAVMGEEPSQEYGDDGMGMDMSGGMPEMMGGDEPETGGMMDMPGEEMGEQDFLSMDLEQARLAQSMRRR